MVEAPSEINIIGDSSAIISILDCENKVLSPYFDSRVGEIKEHRNEWRKYSKVNTVQHTPGSLNPADICTKGKAKADDIMFGSDWQLGPEYLQFDDRSAWPFKFFHYQYS